MARDFCGVGLRGYRIRICDEALEQRLLHGGGRRGIEGFPFFNLDDLIGLQPTDDGTATIAPEDFYFQRMGRTGRKDTESLVSGQVTTTRNHLLGLSHRTSSDLDPRPNACGIAAGALQTNGQARSRAAVTEHSGRTVEHIDDDVEIPIIVEIPKGHAVGESALIKAPTFAGIFKGQVPAIAKGHRWGFTPREQGQSSLASLRGLPEAFPDNTTLRVNILHIVEITGGQQQVLPTVEVHVEERR